MKLLLILLAITTLQSGNPIDRNEKVILYRLESVIQLRKAVMNKFWPGSADAKYDIPIIYYADSACYVANPTEKFLQQFKCTEKYKTNNLVIYATESLIDSIPFHMEVFQSDAESNYDYKVSYARVSGLEQVRKYAPTLGVRQWTAMVLHELFHGYQFHHQDYRDYVFQKNLGYKVINDTLQNYYNTMDWFKQSVDQENDLMLQAIGEKDKPARKKLTLQMFALRDARIKKAHEELNKPVEFYESGFGTMEGTARYIEEGAIYNFDDIKYRKELLQAGSNYRSALSSKELVNPEAGYKTQATMLYTYALGYNMARLLDKFGSDYKTRLFRAPELTLDKILREEAAK